MEKSLKKNRCCGTCSSWNGKRRVVGTDRNHCEVYAEGDGICTYPNRMKGQSRTCDAQNCGQYIQWRNIMYGPYEK